MTIDEDDARKPNISHQVGEDLSTLSLQELDERIALLISEIDRLKQEKQTKQTSFAAADSVFKI